MSADELYQMLTQRVTDANRPALAKELHRLTGFTSLGIFNAATSDEEKRRVLPQLLSLAFKEPETGQSLTVNLCHNAGAVPVDSSTTSTPQGISTVLKMLQEIERTPGVSITAQVYIIVNTP